VRFAQVGTACVAIVSVGLGIVPWYWAFAVLAVAQGLGLLINTPTHSSLITDYYPPEALGTTFTFYLFGGAAAALLASPIAGGLGQVVGWRATFLLLAIPAGIGVVLMGRLHEPSRGASIGLSVEHEERASFAEGFRRVKAVRSLRRTWWAATFFGGGAVAFRPLSNIFFKDVYHYGAAARGGIAAIFGVGGLVGIIVGGRVVQARLRRGQPELLPVINGVAVVVFGAGVLLMGLMPFSLGSAAMLFFVGAGASAFLPAYNAMIGLVTAPRLRGQAFSYSLLWVALGAVVVGATIGGISNHHQRAAAYVLGALIMMAGLVEVTARQFVQRDVAEARQVQTAADVDALLAVRGLEAAYAGNVQVLFGVDLDVHEGEIVALLGTNGAGKSTLLRTISGLVIPDRGVVRMNGRTITLTDPEIRVAMGMIQVPGGEGIFPNQTVAENLEVWSWLIEDRARRAERIDAALATFPALRERLKARAGSLSGGQQQMLAVSKAVMLEPELLLIDELSLGLAPLVVQELLEVVEGLKTTGVTMVIVEQSVNVALAIADRAVFMERGRVRFEGPAADLLERDDLLRAVFLSGEGA
jgi:ABC-type branched-subunit amino acid transport system ATPase component/predicted MFS family arabinose efflux permease